MRSYAAEKLSKMISFETVSVRGAQRKERFEEYFKLLSSLYPNVFKATERILLENTLLLRWRGTDSSRSPVVLMSHSDVVEAGAGWSVPPFSGWVAGGVVWGRGAADTKCSLCAIFEAASRMVDTGRRPARDVYILSTTDEEIVTGCGASGAVQYFREHGLTPAMVLDEGGAVEGHLFKGIRRPYALIGVAEKDYLDVILTARGPGGHSSVPGRNTPLVALSRTVCEIEGKSPFVKRLTPVVSEMLKSVARDMPFPQNFLFARPELFYPIIKRTLSKRNPHTAAMLQTTCAFTMCTGSGAANVIPREATVTANLRLLPGDSPEEVIKKLRKIAGRYGIEVRPGTAILPNAVTSTRTRGYLLTAAAIKVSNPRYGVAPYQLVGATDSRHFGAICPCVIKFSPFFLNEQQNAAVHAADENISVRALLEGVNFYKQILLNLSKL